MILSWYFYLVVTTDQQYQKNASCAKIPCFLSWYIVMFSWIDRFLAKVRREVIVSSFTYNLHFFVSYEKELAIFRKRKKNKVFVASAQTWKHLSMKVKVHFTKEIFSMLFFTVSYLSLDLPRFAWKLTLMINTYLEHLRRDEEVSIHEMPSKL